MKSVIFSEGGIKMSKVLSGTEIAKTIFKELKEESDRLISKGIDPTIAIMRVGSKKDDIAYERGILRNCEKTGIKYRVIELEENISLEEFIEVLEELNNDAYIHGILIFRPLPKHLDKNTIKHIINPEKDIDCMNPLNLAKVFEGDYSGFPPCTPAAVMEIIKRRNIDLTGKNTVVLGRSMVVGKPLSMMLLKSNATVTICHSKTTNLHLLSSNADILIAAIGKAKFVDTDYVKNGAIVFDVGINIDAAGKLCGDVDFDSVSKKASLITPVPGGVGSVTTAILLMHVIKAAKNT